MYVSIYIYIYIYRRRRAKRRAGKEGPVAEGLGLLHTPVDKMPLKIHWTIPVKIHWTSDNPLENTTEM